MNSDLKRYLDAVVVLLSVGVGALLTSLVLPTTGEAVTTGSVLLWTAVFALLLGGGVSLAFLRDRSDSPTVERVE